MNGNKSQGSKSPTCQCVGVNITVLATVKSIILAVQSVNKIIIILIIHKRRKKIYSIYHQHEIHEHSK